MMDYNGSEIDTSPLEPTHFVLSEGVKQMFIVWSANKLPVTFVCEITYQQKHLLGNRCHFRQ